MVVGAAEVDATLTIGVSTILPAFNKLSEVSVWDGSNSNSRPSCVHATVDSNTGRVTVHCKVLAPLIEVTAMSSLSTCRTNWDCTTICDCTINCRERLPQTS